MVTICIPTYDRPVEVGQAIRSVVCQEFADLEILVGDDHGSAQRVVQEIADGRVRYIRNPQRLGMAANWTSLLDQASAPLVGLLMDDDQILPAYVRTAVDVFDADPKNDLVFTNHYFRQGERVWERTCSLGAGRYEHFLPSLLRYNPVPVSATLMRREVWRSVRPLPDLLTADLVLQARAASEGAVFTYVSEPLMVYRIHPGQLSGSEQRFRDDGVRLWELFEFDDPECESLRRTRLARALARRAATNLKLLRLDEARSDLDRAAALDPGSFDFRTKALSFLARHPRTASSTVRVRQSIRRRSH